MGPIQPPATLADIYTDFRMCWWAAQPTPLQALSNGSLTKSERQALCQQLIAQGYAQYMLNAIDEWDWDPAQEFASLWAAGCKNGTPNILQLPLGDAGQYESPGIVNPGDGTLGAYPASIQPGWVATYDWDVLVADGADVQAILKQWFPSVWAPPAPAPNGPTDPVGKQAVGAMYLNAPGCDESNWPNGSDFTDSRGTFTHVVRATPFGTESYWLLNTAPHPDVAARLVAMRSAA